MKKLVLLILIYSCSPKIDKATKCSKPALSKEESMRKAVIDYNKKVKNEKLIALGILGIIITIRQWVTKPSF